MEEAEAQLEDRALLMRVAQIAVPPELLRRGLRDHAQRTAQNSARGLAVTMLDTVSDMGLSGNPIVIAIAARLRLLALAGVVREHLLDAWVKASDEGSTVMRDILFTAAAEEPLVLFPHDRIGFDPESLQRRVLELVAAQGAA
jgi:hypothetical protein